jgi:hypothetical protein
VRHFFPTLIDAGDPSRSPEPSALCLRIVLNDHLREAIARAYILLVFLDRAAIATTPDLTRAHADPGLRGAAEVMTLWHIYQSPTLCEPMYEQLHAVLERAAASPIPLLEWVECTPGTWDGLRAVFRDWASHGLTLKQEKKQSANVESTAAEFAKAGIIPDKLKVWRVRHGAYIYAVQATISW